MCAITCREVCHHACVLGLKSKRQVHRAHNGAHFFCLFVSYACDVVIVLACVQMYWICDQMVEHHLFSRSLRVHWAYTIQSGALYHNRNFYLAFCMLFMLSCSSCKMHMNMSIWNVFFLLNDNFLCDFCYVLFIYLFSTFALCWKDTSDSVLCMQVLLPLFMEHLKNIFPYIYKLADLKQMSISTIVICDESKRTKTETLNRICHHPHWKQKKAVENLWASVEKQILSAGLAQLHWIHQW